MPYELLPLAHHWPDFPAPEHISDVCGTPVDKPPIMHSPRNKTTAKHAETYSIATDLAPGRQNSIVQATTTTNMITEIECVASADTYAEQDAHTTQWQHVDDNIPRELLSQDPSWPDLVSPSDGNSPR